MFRLAILKLTLLATLVATANEFDKMKAYHEIQRLINVQGDKQTALDLAKKLSTQLGKDDPLYAEIDGLLIYLNDGNPHYPLEKAIKFSTGSKDEIYCKGKGLVYVKAAHNDGTTSEVKLIKSNRKFSNDYSILTSGDWVYELDTAYREPTQSESWLESATEKSFKIKELRKRNDKNNQIDQGSWQGAWSGDEDVDLRYNTNGDTPEPMPIFLANDYHLWGASDLGFKIKFKVGFKDHRRSLETGAPKVIRLKADREVTKKLEKFETYTDCYNVHYEIKLDRLEDRKTRKK